MKKMKRWIALILNCMLVLSLAACKQDKSVSPSAAVGTGKGRYVETDVTPANTEGEMLASFLTDDGMIVCYTQDLSRKFESADDGESWQESAGPTAESPISGIVQNIGFLPDGNLLAALSDETGSLTGLVKILQDGTLEPFAVPELDDAIATGPQTYLNTMEVLSATRLFLDFSSGGFGSFSLGNLDEGGETDPGQENPVEGEGDLQIENHEMSAEEDGSIGVFTSGEQMNFSGLIDLANGKVIAEYTDWFGMSVSADEDTLYMLDYNGEITAKSLEDGSSKKDGEIKVGVDQFAFNLVMSVSENGVYVLDSKSLQKAAEGIGAETVIDSSGYSFSDPNRMPASMHVLKSGSIVLNLMSSDGSRLYKYTLDENATIDPAQTIKVWSLYENYIVRAAISEFYKQNRDATVEYEVAIGGTDGMTPEDAIKNLNTRLLNGDGPDIMLLDGCPAENYANRGMLADLSDIVDTGGMVKNIAAPFMTDSGMFYLPMNVKIPVLLGMTESFADAGTLQTLVEMVQAGNDLPEVSNESDAFSALPEEERPVLSPGDLEEVFNLLWNSGSGSVIPEGTLDSGALRELLAALLAIGDKYDIISGESPASSAMVAVSTGGAAATITSLAFSYGMQRAVLGAYTADDMQLLQMMMEAPDSKLVSFPGLSDSSFVPVCMVGLNSESEKKELAAEFINTMLGETVQGTRSGAGFPVTEAGAQKQIADIDTMMRENLDQSFTFDYTSLIALAQTPQLVGDVVKDMIWLVAQDLCAGNIDLEGAVKQLEQDLKNYLAEQQ